MPQVPFADDGGDVAQALEDVGDRDLAGADDGWVRGEEHGLDADALVMPAGEEGGTRAGADRAAGVKAGEANAFLRHAVDVRRLEPRGAVAANVGVAEVVREDEDDV